MSEAEKLNESAQNIQKSQENQSQAKHSENNLTSNLVVNGNEIIPPIESGKSKQNHQYQPPINTSELHSPALSQHSNKKDTNKETKQKKPSIDHKSESSENKFSTSIEVEQKKQKESIQISQQDELEDNEENEFTSPTMVKAVQSIQEDPKKKGKQDKPLIELNLRRQSDSEKNSDNKSKNKSVSVSFMDINLISPIKVVSQSGKKSLEEEGSHTERKGDNHNDNQIDYRPENIRLKMELEAMKKNMADKDKLIKQLQNEIQVLKSSPAEKKVASMTYLEGVQALKEAVNKKKLPATEGSRKKNQFDSFWNITEQMDPSLSSLASKKSQLEKVVGLDQLWIHQSEKGDILSSKKQQEEASKLQLLKNQKNGKYAYPDKVITQDFQDSAPSQKSPSHSSTQGVMPALSKKVLTSALQQNMQNQLGSQRYPPQNQQQQYIEQSQNYYNRNEQQYPNSASKKYYYGDQNPVSGKGSQILESPRRKSSPKPSYNGASGSNYQSQSPLKNGNGRTLLNNQVRSGAKLTPLKEQSQRKRIN